MEDHLDDDVKVRLDDDLEVRLDDDFEGEAAVRAACSAVLEEIVLRSAEPVGGHPEGEEKGRAKSASLRTGGNGARAQRAEEPAACVLRVADLAVARGPGGHGDGSAGADDSADVDGHGVDEVVGVTTEGGRGRATSRFEISEQNVYISTAWWPALPHSPRLCDFVTGKNCTAS